ncbi:hypothetical protein [Solibacillus sp. R5-41]|uniref:hypothetical protein n=1 Tax=Solibacillus sp. R5-41 TaxID=2048654 RepID=UPI0012FE4883|nr:hypothetical protein [Solibacillus sp. R5-41]
MMRVIVLFKFTDGETRQIGGHLTNNQTASHQRMAQFMAGTSMDSRKLYLFGKVKTMGCKSI